MPKLNLDALAFAIVWAALAVAGGVLGGWVAGAILSVGLLVVVMGTGSIILAKTGNIDLERGARWGLLFIAALIFWIVVAS